MSKVQIIIRIIKNLLVSSITWFMLTAVIVSLWNDTLGMILFVVGEVVIIILSAKQIRRQLLPITRRKEANPRHSEQLLESQFEYSSNLVEEDFAQHWMKQFHSWWTEGEQNRIQYENAYRAHYVEESPELPIEHLLNPITNALQAFVDAFSHEREGLLGNSTSPNLFFTKSVECIKLINLFSQNAFRELEELIRKEQVNYVTLRSRWYRSSFNLIAQALGDEPDGVLQKDIYPKLKGILSRDRVSEVLYFAEIQGKVLREKSGKTYRLSLVSTDMPPLISFSQYNTDHLDPSKRIAFSDSSMLLKQATVKKDQGDIDGAIQILRKANESMSKSSDIEYTVRSYMRLPLYLQKAGQYDEAITEFEKLLQGEYLRSFNPHQTNFRDHEAIYDKMRLVSVRETKYQEAIKYTILSYINGLQANIEQTEYSMNQILKKMAESRMINAISRALIEEVNEIPNIDMIRFLNKVFPGEDVDLQKLPDNIRYADLQVEASRRKDYRLALKYDALSHLSSLEPSWRRLHTEIEKCIKRGKIPGDIEDLNAVVMEHIRALPEINTESISKEVISALTLKTDDNQ